MSESLLERIRRRDPEFASTPAIELAAVERSLFRAIETIPDARMVEAAMPLVAAGALGIAFQIRDDLRDLGPPEVSGKAMGTDLRAGVRTLPLLYALTDDGPIGRRLHALVADGPVTDEARLREAVTLLIRSPTLPQVRVELRRQVALARDQLCQLPA